MAIKLSGTTNIKELINGFNGLETKLKSVGLTIKQLETDFTVVKTKIDGNSKTVIQLKHNLGDLVTITKQLNNGTVNYNVTQTKLNTELAKNVNTVSNLNAQYKTQSEVLKSLKVNLSEYEKISSSTDSKGNVTETWTNNSGKMLTLNGKLIDGNIKYIGSLKEVNNAVDHNAKQANKWQYSWSKAFQSFLTYMSVTTVFYQIKNIIVDMISEVTELDSALVELQKVTDLSGESLQNFTKNAYDAAESVAKTGTEMVQAATEFAKAGYDESQVLKLGELALMYTNIADETVSAAEASEFMIAQMKAFNIEANEAIHIIDAVNEVANNFAVSSADIANNLGKSSAVMANAGNSYEQMIGLITAGTEITRNASKVSNGLKTITLRLQGMDDEGEESLELVAQMEALFNKLNLSLYNTDGSLKNTYDILKSLAPVYQEVTAAEKAYITETIAGKYQAQNAAAILNNFQTALEATETALNSEGSAMEENAKVIDSIQGKISSFKSAFEELANTFISSDFIKGIVDFGTALLKVGNSDFGRFIVQVTSSLLGLKMLSVTLDFTKQKFGALTGSIVQSTVAAISNNLAETSLNKTIKKNIVSLLSERGAINKKTGSIKTSTLATIKAKLATSGLSKEQQKAILTQITVTATQKAAAKSTNILTSSWNKLTAAIAANPIGAAIIAITAMVTVLQYFTESSERAKERYQELQSEANEAKTKLENVKNEIKTTNDRITELQSKGPLTFVEKEELDNLELANRKLETQLELYQKIADNKNLEAQNAANNAFNAEYNSQWSYKKTTNDGKLQDMSWLDYMNPVNIYNALSGNDANYGFDTNIITEAVNQYADLANQAELTKEEIEQMTNLEISLMGELSKLEEILPNLSGKAKEQAQEMRDYIVQLVTPEIFQKEKTNNFFGEDKEQFEDIQKQMDKLYKKGELTSEKIWELRKDADGNWNELDSYMREENLDNSSIITYYDEIYKAAEESAEKETDAYQKAAALRKNAGAETSWDKIFLGYLSGEETTNSDYVLKIYDDLKNLEEAGKLSADTIRELNEEFGFLQIGDEALGEIAEILQYFSQEAQTSMSSYSTSLDKITSKYNTLTSAVDEYNNAGYLTSATLKTLMDNDLLRYLSYENGQLVANTSELYNNAEAYRVVASQELSNAMTADILQIAANNLEGASSLAQTAVSSLGNSAENAANQAGASTDKFISFAEAVDLSNKALGGKDLTTEVRANIKAAQEAYKPYFDLISKPIEINKISYTGSNNGSSSNSSSSSSSKSSSKEWWEIELEKLKDQFKYNELTIEEYISGLSNLLGRLGQGTDAWKQINEELQKQRLSKIEDDYKRGTISLKEYVTQLKEMAKAYKVGSDAWLDLADKIKKGLQDLLGEEEDDYNTAHDAAVQIIEDEIDRINELKDAEEERYDALIAEKEKANEETEKEIELARLQEALVNAQREKTKRVWREGIGKKSADLKDNYIGQMLEIVKTEVRLNLRWCVYG